MTPLFFGESGSPLYGVYHPPAKSSFQKSAFLICSPIGHEYAKTYSAIKKLAQSLAEAGAHVLRFSYTGLGDSSSASEKFSIWQALRDIQVAMDELQDMAALKVVSVIGLRFGALLATEIACSQPIEKLILWEPVLSGKNYLENAVLLHKQMLVDPSRFDLKYTGIQSSSAQLLGHPYSLQEQDIIASLCVGNLGELKTKSVTIHTSNPDDIDIRKYSQLANRGGRQLLEIIVNDDDGAWQSLEVEKKYLTNHSISNIVDKAI